MNGTFAGYGKMLSRFLHIFGSDVTAKLREWNMSLNDDELFIEDCDASYFNANLHPPLMPYEVWMPGGHNSLPPSQQLPITGFKVKHDPASGRVQLLHEPTGKRAFIYDLGFQGHTGRSQLFQLLEKFTKTRYLFTSPLTSALAGNKKKQVTNEVLCVPRVVYEDRIVLQRKGWYISKALIPVKAAQETASAYFNRLNTWRRELQMPDDVFVFVTPDRYMANADPSAVKKAGRDDYKPQYISFNSPLLVTFFEKITAKAGYSLKIEEMLPAPGSLLRMGDSSHVTEFVVQWYNFAEQGHAHAAKAEMMQMDK
jgi:hypothetical protein